MKFEKQVIKESKTIEEAAIKLCGYGYYDSNGISRKDIIKYMKLGVEFAQKGDRK